MKHIVLIILVSLCCGAALVVARANKSRVSSLEELVSNLAETPALLAGVIYNEY